MAKYVVYLMSSYLCSKMLCGLLQILEDFKYKLVGLDSHQIGNQRCDQFRVYKRIY